MRATRALARYAALLVIAVTIAAPKVAHAEPVAAADLANIVYKTVGGISLRLDLFFATAPGTHPLIVWVHGGGWQSGSKANCLPTRLGITGRGYHIACIDYRLTDQAIHPAQIQDVKSAIVFLRSRAAQYRIDPQRVVLWGSSAGGHLAALAGTTSGDPLFTSNPTASTVQAVVDYYGPTDLLAMVQTPGYESHQAPDSPESKLLGAPVLQVPGRANAASPATYVTAGDPPFFIVHGTADPVVPPQQSSLLRDALRGVGVPVSYTSIAGAGHGGPQFSTPQLTDAVLVFLQQHL